MTYKLSVKLCVYGQIMCLYVWENGGHIQKGKLVRVILHILTSLLGYVWLNFHMDKSIVEPVKVHWGLQNALWAAVKYFKWLTVCSVLLQHFSTTVYFTY